MRERGADMLGWTLEELIENTIETKMLGWKYFKTVY